MISNEMKAQRKNGIGGSDAGAIMGYNKYKDISKLYLEKIGEWEEVLDEQQQDRCDLGNFLEEYVAAKFQEKTGKKVLIDEKHYKDDKYSFIQANIDRRIEGENAILECKTATEYLAKEWKDGEIPAAYIWQCLHYMHVLKLDRVYLACQLGFNKSIIINNIDRNQQTESLIKMLIDKEIDFWKCVQNKIPPIPIEPTVIEKDEPITLELQKELKAYDDIQEMKKDLKIKEEKLKQSIIHKLQGYTTAISENRKITYKTQVRNVFDTTKFKKEYKELYNKFIKKSETKVLKING